jgi:K(+)-stimulated pyrophosphate-energized sodium pump
VALLRVAVPMPITPPRRFGAAIPRPGWAQIPLVFAAIGVVAAVVGSLAVRVHGRPGGALNHGMRVGTVAFAGLGAAATSLLGLEWRVFGAAIAGLVAGSLIGITTIISPARTAPRWRARQPRRGAGPRST